MSSPEPSGGASSPGPGDEGKPFASKIKRLVIGAPRDIHDRSIFHRISLVALLAWIGLGADGLSSSCYGPEEAFRTLGAHTYLAIGLALLMGLTVMVISAAYSRIIEEFPSGGGYFVATKLLGPKIGVISGCALLVDYVMTITVSIASAGDALFSFLPPSWAPLKYEVEIALIIGLTILNIRGVKESVLILTPIFVIFLILHVFLIVGGVVVKAGDVPQAAAAASSGFRSGLTNLSLALTASGLLLCYLLWNVSPVEGKTLNAVLVERFTQGMPLAPVIIVATLVSEGALLIVGALAGFIGGPRILANMAVDGWIPRRFAALSERLTTENGILLMGAASIAALVYTHGDVRQLVIMYSINVFLTFSLSMFGMARLWLGRRKEAAHWRRKFLLFAIGLALCGAILVITIFEKFSEGGWITLLVTGVLVVLCLLINRHYKLVVLKLKEIYKQLEAIPEQPGVQASPFDPSKPIAAVLVASYSGLGIHTVLNIFRQFPGLYKNLIFISVGVVDSGEFKGEGAIDALRERTEATLKKYEELARNLGIPAISRFALGTDAMAEAERLCLDIAREFPSTMFFAGKLVFQREKWYQRLLHNETAFYLSKRLNESGRMMVVLPARVT
ncbi:MAG: APC family permease [Candidatus Sumerlaeota bacterium]|nr:APC family permease [Candidatus Sumerlaeota bacterium]